MPVPFNRHVTRSRLPWDGETWVSTRDAAAKGANGKNAVSQARESRPMHRLHVFAPSLEA